MLRRILNVVVLGLLVWAAWTVWQPQGITHALGPVVKTLPERPGEAGRLWRVVTRRMILPQAVQELAKTLAAAGLPPAITVEHREQVELHAFDDPRSFATRDEAVKVRQAWKEAGFDAELVKQAGHFGVALGRLYMTAYAQELQQRLDRSGRPYTYQQRLLNLSTWRFTFAPEPYAQAHALWLKVQALGVADPVMMRQEQFATTFGSGAATLSPQ